MKMKNRNKIYGILLIAMSCIFTQIFAAEISGYRDLTERVVDNKGIELLLFKKMTDKNMEHFSVRNTTSKTISNIKGTIIYRDMKGNQITSQPFTINETLVPGEAELTSISSFDQNQEYSFHMNFDPRGLPPGVKPFTAELADISYRVVNE